VPRLDALDFGRANGLPILTRSTPDGEPYFVGTCPKCGRGVRRLFQIESGVLCRKCAKLIYTSESQRNSVADTVRRNPEATGAALETLQSAVETGDKSKYNEAMKVLNVSQNSPFDRLPATTDAEAIFAAEIRNRIIADDLQTATGLVEIIKNQILAGLETTTNRRGEPLEIAMRGDTLAKLVAAWATVSNVRSNRAGQVAQILEKRTDSTTSPSIRELLTQSMKEANWRSRDGYSLEDLENADTPINYSKRLNDT
jgi:antitoxin (DNA-binding transcriptional repressor) of toxin-antitoxin stability system